MDVDTVLLSVQERDKWRRRVQLLEESLASVRDRRSRLQRRLKRVRRELVRLAATSDALLDHGARVPAGRTVHAARDPRLPAR